MQPAVRKLKEEYADRITFESYDVDANSSDKMERRFHVSAIPVFVTLNGAGEQVFKHTGGINYTQMKSDLEYALKQ
jgi:Thioredoxin